MIWAILAFLGVPLWLCAAGITVLVMRHRALAGRHGDVPVRVRPEGKSRWVRGHAVWVSDVFAWRGSPAAWNEALEQVVDLAERDATPEEHKKLHRLSENPVLVTMTTPDGHTVDVATTPDERPALLGPFAVTSAS